MSRTIVVAVLALASIVGCASERRSVPHRAASPGAAAVSGTLDATRAYLVDARATFVGLASKDPAEREAALAELAARPVPETLAEDERATIRVEIDRERALAAYDAGRDTDAVVAIERALGTAEAMRHREIEFTAGLLLTAELIYARAGREDAARWAHGEASVLIRRATGP